MGQRSRARSDGLMWGEGTIVDRGGGRIQARWVERQPDGTRKRRARTFHSLDEAEDHLRKLFRDKRDGRYVPPSEATVADLIGDWLTRGRSRWTPSTQATYRQRAETHVLPELGHLRAETLTTPRIQRWIDGMIRAGFDASTIDTAYRVLNGALREAVQIGIIPSNPAAAAKRPPVEIKEAPTWSAAEVEAVRRVVHDDPFWHALYRVALTTGLRPGELRALRWADVDLPNGLLTVRRTITKNADGHVVIGNVTKTRRSRRVVLSAPVVRALTEWRKAQITRRLAAETWHDEDLVFDRGDGRFLPLTTWQKKHEAIIAAAGVRRITLHQLRHSYATLELEAGTHPKIVQERLGHRSIQTTLDRYSHVSLDLQRAAAEALDERIFGADPESADTTTSGVK